MKKVVSQSEVAHLWANKLQDDARTSHNSMSFEGDNIYSYNMSIASHYKDNIVLFTNRNSTNTTSRHKWRICQAIPSNKEIVYCPAPDSANNGWHSNNIEYFLGDIKRVLEGLVTARKPEKYINPALYIYNQYEKYIVLFKLEANKDIEEIVSDFDRYKEYLKECRERDLKEAEELQVRRILEYNEDAIKFLNFETNYIYKPFGCFDVIRFNKDKREYETSQQVRIPELIMNRYIARYKANDIKVDDKVIDFNVLGVTDTTITIGCHYLEIKQILELEVV